MRREGPKRAVSAQCPKLSKMTEELLLGATGHCLGQWAPRHAGLLGFKPRGVKAALVNMSL